MKEKNANKFETIITMFIVALLAVLLFSLCYQTDNKYTYDGVQASKGVLNLGDKSPEGLSMAILVDDWEFYNGALIAPMDFAVEAPTPRYIFIGQFGGFEAGDKTASPHGSATYRMTILLPEEPKSYTLELPEIYSSYKLYLNGTLAEQFGNPEREAYSPQTGSSSVGVVASGSLEIILAVSDYSHIYSGLTYPPAFGRTSVIAPYLATKNVARESASAISLAMTAFFIMMGLLLKNKKTALLYGLFCLSFFGSIVVPVLKNLFYSGLFWYSLEQFFYRLMLLVVLLFVIRITEQKGMFPKTAMGVAVFCTITALILPSLVGSYPVLLSFYSDLTSFYKWGCAVYFTVSLVQGVQKNKVSSMLLLAGVLVFDCALVADRLLPMFEPIYFFWFSEWAGLFFLIVLGVIVARELILEVRQNIFLKEKTAVFERFVGLQNSYYPVLLEQIKDAQTARHDLRHHMTIVRQLVIDENTKELMKYLGTGDSTTPILEAPLTSNYVLNVLLRHFSAQAERGGIQLELLVNLSGELLTEDTDLCIVLSNLMENGVEACGYLPEEDRWISLELKTEKAFVVIILKNSYDGTLHRQNGALLSRKRENHSEGIGIPSVCSIAEQYGGAADFSENEKNDEFSAKIILRNKAKEDK